MKVRGSRIGTRFATPIVAAGALIAGIGLGQVPAPRVAVHAVAPLRPIAVSRLAPVASPPVSHARAPVETAFVVKRILPVSGAMRQGEWYWNEAGAPAGPIVVTADLAAQTVSIFRGGYEIGTAVIIHGGDATPTPLGIFPITQKDAHHVSSIYDAPMPYMLRLTDDGISIHGSEVGDGYVTHGCIGVPKAFAKRLFDSVRLGDRVIVTRGRMLGMGQAITA